MSRHTPHTGNMTHCGLIGPDATTHSYPTDSRERRKIREKAAKEAGTPLEVVKKKKFVENHFDDCGEDLSSLNMPMEDDVSIRFTSYFKVNPDCSNRCMYESDSESDGERIEKRLTAYMLFGPTVRTRYLPAHLQVSDLEQFVYTARARGKGLGDLDVAEVCGGEARSTQIGLRRKFQCGPNFDLVCKCDLTQRKDQKLCLDFFQDNDVLVAIWAPVYGPFGSMTQQNW